MPNVCVSLNLCFSLQRNTETVPNMVSPANDLTHVLDQLFNHLPTADMIKAALEKLAEPVAQFFIGAAKRSSKLYTQQFLQKVRKERKEHFSVQPECYSISVKDSGQVNACSRVTGCGCHLLSAHSCPNSRRKLKL